MYKIQSIKMHGETVNLEYPWYPNTERWNSSPSDGRKRKQKIWWI